ncbi:MAG: glycosyltransferase, partial [Candidatus Yanofskybacteria bacterium]|nr:glycosyltransferase [Candidatus Yanofskybacteria bacterium]
MKITIVTLNYNGSEETIELLKSLKEQAHSTSSGQADQDFETIVVDNASEEADFKNLQTGVDRLIHSFPLTTSSRFFSPQSGDDKIEDPRFTENESGQVVHPQVKVIRNSQNLGFSGGNNVGIRQALENGASWVVLLNNDTWVERGFMERL